MTLIDLMSRWVSYELQRRQMNAQLLEKNEQLDQFASIVSHDLRNPLRVAEGGLELARGEYDSGDLKVVKGAHDRMEKLIDDLLTLAREGEAIAETTSIDLELLVNGSWANVETDGTTL